MLRSDVEAFESDDEPRTPRGGADWADRFFNRIIAADEAGAWGVMEAALSSGMDVKTAYTDVLVPTMRRVGDAWAAGEIDVAGEHAASEIASRVVARLGPKLARRGIKRGTVVMGSTATELHSLPLSMASDLLRASGFEVVDLGANLPADSFAAFVASTPDLVAIGVGVTTPGQDEELGKTIAALREVTVVPIVVGGSGTDKDTAVALGADAYARTATDAVEVVASLLQ